MEEKLKIAKEASYPAMANYKGLHRFNDLSTLVQYTIVKKMHSRVQQNSECIYRKMKVDESFV